MLSIIDGVFRFMLLVAFILALPGIVVFCMMLALLDWLCSQ